MAVDPAELISAHLVEAKLTGGEDLLDGDMITGAVVVMRVERLDDEEPTFVMAHTGDYITATGLLTLAKGIVMNGMEDVGDR